jgi:antitoxin component of MazEF toxin-antitoxin module
VVDGLSKTRYNSGIDSNKQELEMARETKVERLAREAQERAAYEAEQAATYPDRLMEMLERATKQNFELEVREGKFVLSDRDDRRERTVELTLTYSTENQEALHELDWRVDMKEEAEREAARKAAVRQAALSKLSQEERELLGL